MRKDVIVMPCTGLPLPQVNEIVQSTNFQGFPVVRSETDRTIVGFIRKTDLRYALDRAHRTHHISSAALCTFQERSDALEQEDGTFPQPDIVIPPTTASDHNPYSRAMVDRVDFGLYVDEVS